MFQHHFYYVYMMMSSSRRALYTGITSRPRQQVWEHKTGAIDGFPAQYHTKRLVYLERYRMSGVQSLARSRSSAGDERRILR